MRKTVKTNSAMDKILLSQKQNVFHRANKRKIKAEIDGFFSKVNLHKQNSNECFSAENIFDSSTYIVENCDSITDWEWDNNEIYLYKSIIGTDFKKSICFAVEYIESLLMKRFPEKSFYINISAQHGELRNVNIRIYLNRGKPYVATDIGQYNQPILTEFLTKVHSFPACLEQSEPKSLNLKLNINLKLSSVQLPSSILLSYLVIFILLLASSHTPQPKGEGSQS